MPLDCGSTNVNTICTAIAASTADPPALSTRYPASVASGLAAATAKRCAARPVPSMRAAASIGAASLHCAGRGACAHDTSSSAAANAARPRDEPDITCARAATRRSRARAPAASAATESQAFELCIDRTLLRPQCAAEVRNLLQRDARFLLQVFARDARRQLDHLQARVG